MAQKKSYSELMKASAMSRQRQKEHYVLDLYIESLFFESFLQFHSDRLMYEIDEALVRGDVSTFQSKAKEYTEIQKVLCS
ncbi:hypothetical protein GCM10008967_00960 [Bacillus carboniphilus]|uniref:IDEAL domain-containing protein n=1 Tax=Bacillus carboniphilus TaxID=86663 RepID=A0ABN0VPU6_9BACI